MEVDPESEHVKVGVIWDVVPSITEIDWSLVR